MKQIKIVMGPGPNRATIEVDGKPLTNVVAFVASCAVAEIPEVMFTVRPEALEIEGEAEVSTETEE